MRHIVFLLAIAAIVVAHRMYVRYQEAVQPTHCVLKYKAGETVKGVADKDFYTCE